jgi:hypothetical protein
MDASTINASTLLTQLVSSPCLSFLGGGTNLKRSLVSSICSNPFSSFVGNSFCTISHGDNILVLFLHGHVICIIRAINNEISGLGPCGFATNLEEMMPLVFRNFLRRI